MEENDKRFEMENLAVTTSFSQLLFAADDDNEDDATRRLGFDRIFYADKTPKMLCFGDYNGESVRFTETTTTTTTTTTNKSSVTCSDSSSSASSTKSKTRKRCGGPERETVQCSSMATGNTLLLANRPITTTTSKKTKSEPASNNNNKRKEKLGERIAALQQLVSPFGKTDTASVLHEAMGYIRFLQEQVQVLCSPYLQRFPDSSSSSENEKCGSGGKMKDLRSRGLCLVPVEFTEHVANDNGADLWSPATLGHVSTKH